MMNRIAAIMVCLVLVFSMVSCDDQDRAVGYGSLSVEVSNGDNSKTVRPADESLAFVSYRIEGRHRTIEGRTVDETFTDGRIEIDRLETGEWEFMVEGINKDGVVLAKSDTHIVTIKTNVTAKETYTLSWIVGHGTLRLSVKVQTSRVSTIECQLYDEDGREAGTYVMTKDDSNLDGEGFLVFEHSFTDVPTGSYDATMTMKDKDGGRIGRALHPSVHIHDGLVSSYVFSWENFRNLLPNVDAPKVTNIVEGATTVSCDSTILLGTYEEGTTIFYSLDDKTYSKYQEGAIDLSAMGNINDSISIWTYAEKANLNKSDVAEYTFNVEHNSPDRANATYTWNAIEGGYECIATSKCKYHKSFECEAEKADVSYEVLVDSTDHEEGKCRYTAVFGKEGYGKPTKDEVVPMKHNLVHHATIIPTCTEIGRDEYTCTICEYTTYKEIPALGHDLKSCKRVDDEYHEGVCSRCSKTSKDVHSFKSYKCTECGIWGRGPSGGYVFYDRGKYTGGEHPWRYLEAAPADLRLVNGSSTVDSTVNGYSDGTYRFIFGYYRETSGGSNILLSTETGIGEGYDNTKILVGRMQESAYTSSSGTGTTSNYAARLCHELVYKVNEEDVTGWFLPSKDELNLMYKNLHEQGLGSFANDFYWSSSEGSAATAWRQNFSSGNQPYIDRYYELRVRPVRAF